MPKGSVTRSCAQVCPSGAGKHRRPGDDADGQGTSEWESGHHRKSLNPPWVPERPAMGRRCRAADRPSSSDGRRRVADAAPGLPRPPCRSLSRDGTNSPNAGHLPPRPLPQQHGAGSPESDEGQVSEPPRVPQRPTMGHREPAGWRLGRQPPGEARGASGRAGRGYRLTPASEASARRPGRGWRPSWRGTPASRRRVSLLRR